MATQTIARFGGKRADSKRGKDTDREQVRRQRRSREQERRTGLAGRYSR